MTDLDKLRAEIRQVTHAPERDVLRRLLENAEFTEGQRKRMHAAAIRLVEDVRTGDSASIMEHFLSEYGLSGEEGVALMCLAEALLRVPDSATIDALIEDKIAKGSWGSHLGNSQSLLVNASSWALLMTGRFLNDDHAHEISRVLHGAVLRLGEPIIRTAVTMVMKEMGRQFVLGETIEKAMKRAREQEERGYTYSYDMLGEAAKTEADAERYHMAYAHAIGRIAEGSKGETTRDRPGISIKLSALHPRYELLQKKQVMEVLLPRAVSLAVLAKSAGLGLNIDAEEAARLGLSLDVIEGMLEEPGLAQWDGLGVVVQTYLKSAPLVIDWLYEQAGKHNRKIMVRLVKGAYWDTEIKHAQVEGLEGFPVFTRKPSTDVSYLCCARKLLAMTDRIYPQFATHNAHSAAAVLDMATDNSAFEFQRLHGMGEALHDAVLTRHDARCRIYAPVGAHEDLLAYLVRRLLENGANSSFVNQIVDQAIAPEHVVADPISKVERYLEKPEHPKILAPSDLFLPQRKNSRGWDLGDPSVLRRLEAEIAVHREQEPATKHCTGKRTDVINPANGKLIGMANFASADEAGLAADEVSSWADAPVTERAKCLGRAADLYESHSTKFYDLLMREAGKTLIDCIGEVREAVDFLRYYAAKSVEMGASPIGIVSCVSPWNFPLAIFTGQISAALAAGNGVLAKPAEATTLIADFAVDLLYQAGIPREVLKLVAGEGAVVGNILSAHPKVSGVCFTGSTQTAQTINLNMARNLAPTAPLIAETGGLNAMIVDSTALFEQAVEDVIASAFQSAGQRCSALRVLYVQEEVADKFLKMLFGAMDCLVIGDPRDFQTDIGPVINAAAKDKIMAHIATARAEGRLLKELNAPEVGTFVGPSVLSIDGISALKEEIFGPVLHVARYEADELDDVVAAVNASGYGLTFGIHTRIDERVAQVAERLEVGNIYVNRNQIGAIVGSQPFGGCKLSGTGPKAGGPRYLWRFSSNPKPLQSAETALDLPGPTGEANRYELVAKKHIYCLGPSADDAQQQAEFARAAGCEHVEPLAGAGPGILAEADNIDAAIYWGEEAESYRLALAQREGALVPLIMERDFAWALYDEVTLCIDTTASGGNADLLGITGE